MKERENREFWIRQTTTPSRYLSIDIFVLLLQGFFGFGRTWTPPEPNGPRVVFTLARAAQVGYLN